MGTQGGLLGADVGAGIDVAARADDRVDDGEYMVDDWERGADKKKRRGGWEGTLGG